MWVVLTCLCIGSPNRDSGCRVNTLCTSYFPVFVPSLCHPIAFYAAKQKKHLQDSCLNLHHALLLTHFETSSLIFPLLFNETAAHTRSWLPIRRWLKLIRCCLW